MKREYKICGYDHIRGLEESVNRMLSKGWEVNGDLIIDRHKLMGQYGNEIENVLYWQTIVKKN